MTFCYAVLLWFALTYQCVAVTSLESVEELLCDNMKAGSRIPHPEFCNIYIICTDNAAMQISCERKVLYNPVTEVCDAHYRVCLGGLIKNQDGSMTLYKDETDSETESASDSVVDSVTERTIAPSNTVMEIKLTTSTVVMTSILSTSQQSFSSLVCPTRDSDKLLLVSHATKCSVYLVCYHGKPIPMECSMGLYWSERNYKCVPKELSECHGRSAKPYPRCPPVGIDFLPHETICDRFWYCRDGFQMLQQCDAFLQWDVNEKKCKRIGQAVCFADLLKSLNY